MVDMVRNVAKRIAFSMLGTPALLKRKIERSARDRNLTILSFHRVGPLDGSAYPPLAPDLFDEALSFCKRNFELVQFKSLEESSSSGKPLAIISFDDGYADFLEYSLPMLRRHGVRCNHNLIPACLVSGSPPLNVLIQDFIGKAPAGELHAIDRLGWAQRPCANDRLAAGLEVSRFLKSKPIAEQRALVKSLENTVDLKSYATPMMSLADARSIREHIEVGAHSFEHATLSAETDEYIADDAQKCRQFFEQDVGAPTDIYALPNGEGAERATPILRKAGFRQILLTDEAYSNPASLDHPRFTMTGSSRAEVRFRSAGFVRH
jgi:peptidoglycan/xylan/chitin deacetylase (PgdA/CDA1 family)